MINNFKVIEDFMQFEAGTFYKFELLIRNTDGDNVLFLDGYSNTNKNILIKNWYVDNKEYYEKIKHEMVTLANLTGARLYVTLDRKENLKLIQSLTHAFTDTLCNIAQGQQPSIKSISKTFASETSKVENSCKSTKTIMFDIDTKDDGVLNLIQCYIHSKGQQPFILQTKKGYHIFCYKKFNHADWLEWVVETAFADMEFEDSVTEKDYKTSYAEKIRQAVSVKENELGLIYHPMLNQGEENA